MLQIYFWRALHTMNKSNFIVLEGLDRSGKSSMASHLSELLSKHKRSNSRMNFPDRTTPIGQMISNFLSSSSNIELSNEAIHLLFSANRWEKQAQIRNLLGGGNSIICDRYWYSGVAYSAAKGMDLNWCSSADKGLPEPDLVIYLKADPESLSSRQNYGNQRFQKLQFQKKVKSSFEQLFQECGEKVKVVEIQGKGLEQVKKEVGTLVEDFLQLQ